jgi:hypothetical protein
MFMPMMPEAPEIALNRVLTVDDLAESAHLFF